MDTIAGLQATYILPQNSVAKYYSHPSRERIGI